MDMVMDNILRWRILADILKKENKKAFIEEMNGNLHFCEIIFVSENKIKIKNFDPIQRRDKIEEIYWIKIIDFDEYQYGEKK